MKLVHTIIEAEKSRPKRANGTVLSKSEGLRIRIAGGVSSRPSSSPKAEDQCPS